MFPAPGVYVDDTTVFEISVSHFTIPENVDIAASTFTMPAETSTSDACTVTFAPVVIETPEENYTLLPGDFVIFKDGLECVWDVKKPVKKHYNFP